MELVYKAKKTYNEILASIPPAVLVPKDYSNVSKNMLIFGDNLLAMSTLIKDHSLAGAVNLVYIDPPFATNTVFRTNDQRSSHVSLSLQDEIAYSDVRVGAEYIEFLRERLMFLRDVMASDASIYLHIDYKIGHYVKMIMDEIFGGQNFRNDISRIKCNPKNFARKAYGNVKDMVLFYTKSERYTWNEPQRRKTPAEVSRLFGKMDRNGRRYTTTPVHAPGETRNGNTGKTWKGMLPPKGRHWRYDPSVLDELDAKGLIEWSATGNPRKIVYADDLPHSKVQDVWEFKDPQRPSYPTEKNFEMLEMIIATSSNPGDTVLDCFCGSGATILAADKLNRQWIGIDSSSAAIKSTLKRLESRPANLLYTPSQFTYYTVDTAQATLRYQVAA